MIVEGLACPLGESTVAFVLRFVPAEVVRQLPSNHEFLDERVDRPSVDSRGAGCRQDLNGGARRRLRIVGVDPECHDQRSLQVVGGLDRVFERVVVARPHGSLHPVQDVVAVTQAVIVERGDAFVSYDPRRHCLVLPGVQLPKPQLHSVLLSAMIPA